MTDSEEGVEQLDVRTKWPHEAHDFTCWLAEEENLNLLGDELGLTLKFVAREKQVGPMYLDILAREADTGGLVAIENQLEESDLGHLGQLLTYATGLDAYVGIWVAPAFYHEFAQALHKLNQWTREAIRFYGVKIELVSKDGGEPEPRFSTVVRPGEWCRDRTLPPYAKSASWQQHDDFFRPLMAELTPAQFADRATQYFGHAGRIFRSGDDGIGYAVSFFKDAAWVTLSIRVEDSERSNRIFDALHAKREEIQAEIVDSPEPDWVWDRYDRFTFFEVSIRRRGFIDDPPAELERTRAWMLDLLPRFKQVFDPRVKEILEESRPTNDG